ncbi:carbamoyltransferase HypF [Bacteroidota bacterium]
MNTYKIYIKGLIQGVGFRPFIYRLAISYNISGWVRNTTESVIIHAEGKSENLNAFIKSIETEAPKAANVSDIDIKQEETGNYKSFKILTSEDISDNITEISPDIAVCNSCMEDIKSQQHRINYPFTNCTNCGPRFTIIKDLPYDRDKTTMNEFVMCELCKAEYSEIRDRRFHAQPVACNNCGPVYELISNNNKIDNFNEIIAEVSGLIQQGKIIAIKGLGGFHLACNALDNNVVRRLRTSKLREGKPFAVIFRDLITLKEYCILNETEEKVIDSWRKPILITKSKKHLAFDVSVGFNTIGAMLPYLPFHYLLFEKLKIPAIVLTSGNISEEPILIDNELAKEKLNTVFDSILTYNREIYNRTDDSVCHVINDTERVLRRSRGYAPTPIKMNFSVDGILAVGAELVNCFCIGKENQALLSQHMGDLKNYETYEFFAESVKQYKKLFRMEPKLAVCDMHPDYLSTGYAKELGLPLIDIQHHHAHIASCMAENEIDEKVIGVSFDGTGLGTDGNIWGGEFLFCDLNEFKRYAHFEYIPLPGGDAVTKEPWRVGLSYLHKIYGNDLFNLKIPFINNLDESKAKKLIQAVDHNINCPLSSSAGRLFDAIAAILNICTVSQFHAEAPMRLENYIESDCESEYKFYINNIISFKPTIQEIVNDIIVGIDVGTIAAKFHNTIISVIFATVKQMFEKTGIKKVALSGGTFQNKYLSERIENKLTDNGFELYVQKLVPANDGGIALGQIAIAAKRRELKCV